MELPSEGGWINFGVEVKGEGVLIGELAMGFISAAHAHYEVGYVFDAAYAGHGYATEGAAMIVELAFAGLGAHRVSGRLDARNEPSARVLEKLGMRREAHFIQNEYVKGEWTDELVYAILAPSGARSADRQRTFEFRDVEGRRLRARSSDSVGTTCIRCSWRSVARGGRSVRAPPTTARGRVHS